MNKPVLVVMAAGMGSRFGGLKQVTPVDPEGHPIIDYSLFDAWRAGFRDVVFIIKRELEEETGYTAGEWIELGDFIPTCACDSAPMHMVSGMLSQSGNLCMRLAFMGRKIRPVDVCMPLRLFSPETDAVAITVCSSVCSRAHQSVRASGWNGKGKGVVRQQKLRASASPTYTCIREWSSVPWDFRPSPDWKESSVSPVES